LSAHVFALCRRCGTVEARSGGAAGPEERNGLYSEGETMYQRDPRSVATAIFGWRKLLRSLGGDKQELQKLARMFLEESPRLLAALRVALTRTDLSAVEQTAHRLKGSAAYFVADRTFAAAARLEAVARAGDCDGAKAACAELEEEVRRLRRALAAFDPEPKLYERPRRAPLASH
jgi:HPt (histidine-containing phosphotransfer) domain-containing protein